MDNIINNKIIYSKITILSEQIKLRLTVPNNQRTNKQSIKLDNLYYELNCLINDYYKNLYLD
jgi:hypothetical protein